MKYYCIKQHDITDCAAACLATVSKMNAYGMVKAAERLGFTSEEFIHCWKGDRP